MNIDILRRVRQLVETDFCRDRGIVSELDPCLLRLLHKVPDRSELADFSKIIQKGDTTDEEEKADKANEEEKKAEPVEDAKEEEKKEVAEEEDKKSPEADKEDKEAKAKRKAEQ